MILMFIISIIFCLGGAIAIDVGLIVTGAIAATLGFILFFTAVSGIIYNKLMED